MNANISRSAGADGLSCGTASGMIAPGRVTVAVDAICGSGLDAVDAVSPAPMRPCCWVVINPLPDDAIFWLDGLREDGP